MKKNRIKYSIFLMMSIILLSACHDDSELTPVNPDATLEILGSERISKFNIQVNWVDLKEYKDNLKLRLISLDSSEIEEFNINVQTVKHKLEIGIRIPQERRIVDGRHAMLLYGDETLLSQRILVNFKSELMIGASVIQNDYSGTFADGSGTESDPFIVTPNNFSNFLELLSKDETHAAGLYFKQKRNIQLSQQGESVDGAGYANQSFAGVYDGAQKTISNLTHMGTGTSDFDNNVGLFHTLHNGAVVKNLTIELGTCKGIKENFGFVAANATGTVSIDSIIAYGTVAGVNGNGNNVGGIIGNVSGKDNKITISNIDLSVSLDNLGKNVGGVVGCFNSGELKINKVTTYTKSFQFAAKENVGGIVGFIQSGNASITDCNLEHTSSNVDRFVVIQSFNRGGGVIGYVSDSDVNLTNCYIYCPVGGNVNESTDYQGESIGGLIGDASQTDVNISDCIVVGKIVGATNTGGILGKLIGSSVNLSGDCQMGAYEEAAIGVKGSQNTGGFAGMISNSQINQKGIFITYAEVTGYYNVGGLVGLLTENTELKLQNFKFTESGTFKVKGTSHVGGIVGELSTESSIQGTNASMPDSEFKYIDGPSGNADFYGTVEGTEYVGGIAGIAIKADIESCYVKATVFGNNYVGGIAGYMEGNNSNENENSLRFSLFDGEIKLLNEQSAERTGGIVGSIDGKIGVIRNSNFGAISGGKFTGGIVGHTDYGDISPIISMNVNLGTIKGQLAVGGICGHITTQKEGLWMEVKNCSNFGNVIGTSINIDDRPNWYGVGGILGSCDQANIKVTHCSNHGDIEGNSGSGFHGVGGIAGVMGYDPGATQKGDNLEVYSCANYGLVEASNSWVGGILGYQEEGKTGKNDTNSIVKDCVNYGEIAKNIGSGGGIVGRIDNYANQHRCINFGKVYTGDALVDDEKSAAITHQHDLYYLNSSGNDSWGESFTESEQNKQSTFSGFDFNTVWKLDSGESRPTLRQCAFQFATLPN